MELNNNSANIIQIQRKGKNENLILLLYPMDKLRMVLKLL